MTLATAEKTLRSLQTDLDSFPIIEILILSGEVHPKSDRRAAWFERIYQLCKLSLSLGFLPHTNVGPLSFAEMAMLKQVNVSMGLMVEQVTPDLLQTVHRHAPSKVPELRLQQLEWAGQLRIPFTTGLLVGIGETNRDRWQTLEAIAHVHHQWGHVQEVIVQPYSPGETEAWSSKAFSPQDLVEVITLARRILPAEIAIQVPPNLVQDSPWLLQCLEAGARDLGGIGPRDEVNPDYPHPLDHDLEQTLITTGWQLLPRLPIYSQYDQWLAADLRTAVTNWRSRIGDRHSLHA